MTTIPQLTINNLAYKAFIEKIENLNFERSFKSFKDKTLVGEVTKFGKNLFGSLLDEIKINLEDPNIGIHVLDIPQNNTITPQEDAFYGAAAALSVSWNLTSPALDIVNETPFTIYTASKNNAEKLNSAQIKQNIPEAKLGFHNDGRIDGQTIFVPNTIAIYNILIAYNNPGQFHWVPFSLWTDMEKFSTLFGVNKLYKFNIAPSVYATNSNQLNIHGKSEIIAPLFSYRKESSLIMFLNGDIKSDENNNPVDETLIKALKDSINSNPKKFSIDQKARRLILLGNTLGCHARNIFEEPIKGATLTRVYVRSVDLNGIQLQSVHCNENGNIEHDQN